MFTRWLTTKTQIWLLALTAEIWSLATNRQIRLLALNVQMHTKLLSMKTIIRLLALNSQKIVYEYSNTVFSSENKKQLLAKNSIIVYKYTNTTISYKYRIQLLTTSTQIRLIATSDWLLQLEDDSLLVEQLFFKNVHVCCGVVSRIMGLLKPSLENTIQRHAKGKKLF